jgi:HEAT repeat protein
MRKIFACILAALLALTLTASAADEKPDVDVLIKQLKDDDAVVRLKAAKALGKLGKKAKDAVPALTALLKDKDADVRSVAKNALEAIKGGGDAGNGKVDDIVKDLKSKNAATRMKAVIRLGELGEEGKPAAQPLVEFMMESWPRNREKFFETLELIDPESQKLILAFLTEMEADKKLEAIDGMENLAEEGKACVPVLLKFFYLDRTGKLTRDFSFAQRIIPALIKINPEDKGVITAVLSAVSVQGRLPDSMLRQKAIESVKDLKADPKLVLKALTSALNDPMSRVQAVEAMGLMGKDGKEALPLLNKLKFDMNKDVQMAAMAAIDLIKEAQDKE